MRNFTILILLFVLLVLGWWTNKNFKYPYPAPVNIVTEKTKSIDFAGFLFGMRRIFADINWIQTLQYYGGGGWEEKVDEDKYLKYIKDDRKKVEYGRYKYFLDMCRRCVRIDPYFKYVYLFGGASLAWNLTRYDEALELLNEGMEHDPQYYPFHLYAAAIVYSKESNVENVIENLEKAVKYPDCPFEVKLILGNIYKKQGRYEDSAKIWIDIYFTAKLDSRKNKAKENLIKLIKEKKISPEFLEKIEKGD
jgi:tetratricopeptide (TPR) repeat protein